MPTVKFFTDLREMSGHKVIHQWKYNGKVVSEIEYRFCRSGRP